MGLPGDVAKGLAGIPAFGIKNTYEFLEIRSAKIGLLNRQTNSLAKFEEYSVHPVLAVILASIMFIGMITLINLATGFLNGMALSQAKNKIDVLSDPQLLLLINFLHEVPLQIIGAIYVGRWIGARVLKVPFLVAIACAVTTCLFLFLEDIGIAYFAMDDQAFSAFLHYEKSNVLQAMISHAENVGNLFLFAEYTICTAIGVWLGRRRRLVRSLNFVLNVLPAATREVIVEVARDEAIRVSRKGVPEPTFAGSALQNISLAH